MKVHVFWDNSNIFIEGQRYAEQKEGHAFSGALRIHFDNLFRLATAGRKVGAGVCVGSVPPELRHLWRRLEQTGIEVELFERGAQTGREQGVDQCLQVHMLRTVLDVRPPEIAVVLTGDGAGYEGGRGYHADLERMHRAGWGIEVLSWTHSCARALRGWAESAGIFVPLEAFYDSITFVEDLRKPRTLSLANRPRVRS
jgi:NYN domain